jgi:alkylhydroperoxidase family enzyme
MEPADRFESLTLATVNPAARALLQASASQFGFVPSPVAKAAHAPLLLKHMLAGFAAFEKSSLSATEREVVAFSVAFEIECSYCMAMHSALMADAPDAPRGFVESLRSGSSLRDARLEALHQFVRELVRNRGRASAEGWRAMDAAGFSEEQVLEAVLGIGVYLLSTLSNVVTRAELDPPFEPFRWHKPQ